MTRLSKTLESLVLVKNVGHSHTFQSRAILAFPCGFMQPFIAFGALTPCTVRVH